MSRSNTSLQSRLYHAVVNCEYNQLREVLRRGGNPNTYFGDKYNNNKTNILILACERGLLESARILVEGGAYAGHPDRWGQTPLMYACYAQYSDVVEFLLSRQPQIINIRDNRGKTALHCALEADSLECVKLLLKYGSDVNMATNSGITPLMTLCGESSGEHLDILVELLIAAGADLEMEEFRHNRTALQIATMKRNVTATMSLLAGGANVNKVDAFGRTPMTNLIFQNARQFQINKTLDKDVIILIEMLLHSGIDINMADTQECNPLIMSASLKAEPLVRIFLENGADPDITVSTGMTPLLMAISRQDTESIKTLLQWSSRVDIKGTIYRKQEQLFLNPFELAMKEALWEIVRIFVKADCDVSSYCHSEDLVSSLEVLEWLRQCAINPPSLFHLVMLKLWQILKHKFEEKVSFLPLPTKLKLLISHGNFLSNI